MRAGNEAKRATALSRMLTRTIRERATGCELLVVPGTSLRGVRLIGCELRNAELAGCHPLVFALGITVLRVALVAYPLYAGVLLFLVSAATVSGVVVGESTTLIAWVVLSLVVLSLLHRYVLRGLLDLSFGLMDADLGGSDLRGSSLVHMNLTRASLVGTNLARADLRGVLMRDADLTDASLSGADLRGADLRGAILVRADLSGAKLWKCRLKNADLAGAIVVGTVLEEAISQGA